MCLDCKRRGTVCVTVAHGVPCLGPVTQSGCGAICPAYDRGCYGCFGPATQPNLVSLSTQMLGQGIASDTLSRSLRNFNGHAPPFRAESDRLESLARDPRSAPRPLESWESAMTDDRRTIRVEALPRVEGEGGLYVRLRGHEVEDVQLRIFEPPRLFEALLRGRDLEEVPDIVARICGICPIAYQMSAVHALERLLGIQMPREIRDLRRLLYCGEWIESHALHVHMLHAPDFLGYEDGLSMAADHGDAFRRGLTIKKYGNELLRVLGGRAIHPVNVAVGGFHRLPRRDELAALIPHFEWGVEAAVATTRWVAAIPVSAISLQLRPGVAHALRRIPDERRPHCLDGLPDDRGGRLRAGVQRTAGGLLDRPACGAHEYGLHLLDRTVGPREFESRATLPNSSAGGRRIEDSLAVPQSVSKHRRARARADPRLRNGPGDPEGVSAIAGVARDLRRRPGTACAATEAPRGLLYHRFTVDDQGLVTMAKIVPPTSQNQAQIESDLRAYLAIRTAADDRQIAQDCEHLVRSYDPCISCATHFLKLDIERLP